MLNRLFEILIKDMETQLGIDLDIKDDESLQFLFKDGLMANISFNPEQELLVVDIDLGKAVRVGGEAQNELALFLLQFNYRARMSSGVHVALDDDFNIVLSHSTPVAQLDAGRLFDRMEMMLHEAEHLKTLTYDIDGKKDLKTQAVAEDEKVHLNSSFIQV